jgi:hypothetical protein
MEVSAEGRKRPAIELESADDEPSEQEGVEGPMDLDAIQSGPPFHDEWTLEELPTAEVAEGLRRELRDLETLKVLKEIPSAEVTVEDEVASTRLHLSPEKFVRG